MNINNFNSRLKRYRLLTISINDCHYLLDVGVMDDAQRSVVCDRLDKLCRIHDYMLRYFERFYNSYLF